MSTLSAVGARVAAQRVLAYWTGQVCHEPLIDARLVVTVHAGQDSQWLAHLKGLQANNAFGDGVFRLDAVGRGFKGRH